MKAQQAVVREYGGPEAIEWEEVDLPPPGEGEARVQIHAAGLNMIDTYHRRGIYPVQLPSGLGLELAGLVESVGDGVGNVSAGDRVASFSPPPGAYATARNVAAGSLIKLPNDISDEDAAAVLLKGCTAEFLIERCGKVEAGQTVLVHAAAGATGLILVQWLKAIGARVIGTVSTEEKAAKARSAGADEIVMYREEDAAERVRALTGNAGCDLVLDGVGKATWEASLDSLRPRGLLVSFGNASAPVGEVDLGILARKGSLFTTRPTLFDYYAAPEEAERGTSRLFEMLRSGKVKVEIGRRYPLKEAAEAHRALEARETIGATVLLP